MAEFVPWTVMARNLPEHAGNAIHTDEGARRAGFAGALVAGVTTYAYLTHPVVAAWGRSWLAGGTATVRFHAPVLDGEDLTCTPEPMAGGVRVGIGGPGEPSPRAVLEAWPAGEAVAPAPVGEEVPVVRLRLEGEYSSGYGRRAGDDLPVYERLRVVHPAVWPALANHVVHRYVAEGAWIHLRSRIAHLGLAPDGGLAEIRAVVTERFERKGRRHAVLDVRMDVDGRPAAWLEHEAIVKLPQPG
jgi:hypothetical protein